MITINLLPAQPSLYRQAVTQITGLVRGGVTRFQPDAVMEQVEGLRDRLLAAGAQAPGISRLFARFYDLYSDQELTPASAQSLLTQMKTGLPSLIPGYEELEPIGFGGFSRVYRGLETATGRLVAIKVAARNQEGSPAPYDVALERLTRAFDNEWAVLSRFRDSERIVNVHAYGKTERGKPYLVMEYLDGGTLSQFIVDANEDRRDFDLDQTLSLALQAAEALAVLHQGGYIHNDVKAGNFLLTRDIRAKLADCSMATTIEEAKATGFERGYRGTPGFIAVQTTESPKKDVLALGATLYSLLTGKRAFNPKNPIATMLHTPPPPSVLRPERKIPRRFDKIVLRALTGDPVKRYPDAMAVAEELKNVTRKNPRRRP
jgi:serine/threonine-protein kinase